MALPPVDMGLPRICIDCGESKPLNDYYSRGGANRHLRHLHCKACSRVRQRAWVKANPEKVKAQKERAWAKLSEEQREHLREKGRIYQQSPEGRARRAKWWAENGAEAAAKATEYRRAVGRWKTMEKRYGITKDEHDQMLARQGNACAICALPMERIHIDHDHATGAVRGLLCGPCNRAIGLLKDSPDNALRAAYYLKNGGS